MAEPTEQDIGRTLFTTGNRISVPKTVMEYFDAKLGSPVMFYKGRDKSEIILRLGDIIPAIDNREKK